MTLVTMVLMALPLLLLLLLLLLLHVACVLPAAPELGTAPKSPPPIRGTKKSGTVLMYISKI
jgi:hypothetical protein